MYKRSCLTLLNVLLAGLMMHSAYAVGPSQKGDGGCARCGCDSGCCNAVCRLVKEERELKVTCWTSQCKAVCLPCCTKRGCRHVECACNGGKGGCSDGKNGAQKGDGCDGCCGIGAKKFVWFDYCPGSAKKRCKKHLMKKTVKKTVPGYKWVVEHLCKGCEAKARADAPPVEPDADVPKPPAVDARIIYGKPVHAMASFDK